MLVDHSIYSIRKPSQWIDGIIACFNHNLNNCFYCESWVTDMTRPDRTFCIVLTDESYIITCAKIEIKIKVSPKMLAVRLTVWCSTMVDWGTAVFACAGLSVPCTTTNCVFASREASACLRCSRARFNCSTRLEIWRAIVDASSSCAYPDFTWLKQ